MRRRAPANGSRRAPPPQKLEALHIKPLGQVTCLHLTIGLIAPRKPAPAWLTDIVRRSWFKPFGSLTSTRADDFALRSTFFSVTHWPVAVFRRWSCTALPLNDTPAEAWIIQPLLRPIVSFGCTCTDVGVAYAPCHVAW